jgi:serine/threonine-protein kinase
MSIRKLCACLILVAALAPTLGHAQADPQQADPHLAEEQAAERQALGFLGYLDQGRFADSYAYTGMLIRASLDQQTFAQKLGSARNGAGAMLSRNLIDASYTTTLSGAPDGQYVILHYATSFANRQDTLETVTLAFAKGYWRVSGYYIK